MSENRPTKLVLVTLCAVALAGSLATSPVSAQGKPAAPPAGAAGAPRPGGPSGGGMPRYDKATETTLKGPIVEVKLVDTPSGVQGTHFMLKQGQQTIEVFAGPTVYLTGQGLTFAKGEPVEVIGSKVQVNGAPALLVRQIKKGGKNVAVRDESGSPAWAKKPS
jgi:hypothetical protein